MKSICEHFNAPSRIKRLWFVPNSHVPGFPSCRPRVRDTIAAYGLVRGIIIHMAAHRDLQFRVVEDIPLHIIIPRHLSQISLSPRSYYYLDNIYINTLYS